jgi:hypothetical protein
VLKEAELLLRSYSTDFFYIFENTKTKVKTLNIKNKIYLFSSIFAIFIDLKTTKKAEHLLRSQPTEFSEIFENT